MRHLDLARFSSGSADGDRSRQSTAVEDALRKNMRSDGRRDRVASDESWDEHHSDGGGGGGAARQRTGAGSSRKRSLLSFCEGIRVFRFRVLMYTLLEFSLLHPRAQRMLILHRFCRWMAAALRCALTRIKDCFKNVRQECLSRAFL